ncbi:hypothetical protein [Neobacillus sp. YIM B06451]|uniref:hypothetical protein n=1 Tax=Neobacillus sp. YIM B06451 TaxID=3070994 RepID=UPI002930B6A2|nr:hypothetical protein [Neobacillus sp. YIM B06451]
MKVYRISLLAISVFMVFGFTWFGLGIFSLLQKATAGLLLTLSFPLLFIVYATYLLRKRSQGNGFYWDEEGIVIDLNGNKVYWEEIESIRYMNFRGMKSTVIYPHYTFHEKIRARRNKWMPTTAHSVEWFFIEKPKEFHKNLMKAWEGKQASKSPKI